MLRKFLFTAALISLVQAGFSQSLIPDKWKFSTGDDADWSAPAFDDKSWQTITPGTAWENQGYAGYDGFAWYRVTVMVPSSLKKSASRYNGLLLKLGKIDDVDFTYFNGELIGNTGKLPPAYETRWDEERSYAIPFDKINWDKPNTLAVRVFDLTGDGGIVGSTPTLAIRGIADRLSITAPFTQVDHILTGAGKTAVPVSVKNGLGEVMKGKLTVKIISDFGKTLPVLQKPISLKKGASGLYSFDVSGLEPGFYKALISVSSKSGSKETTAAFGYEPEKIVSPLDAQPDFDDFWKRAKAELAAVEPQFRMIKIDSLCTPVKNMFLVEMRSLGNALIRGWYSVPVAPGRYAAVMQVPGYSSTILPSFINYGDDIIGFGLNIRGHGNSKDDVNPGFPGYILSHLDNREQYIYRGAYMDCVRAIEFLYSRPEVDTTRVVVEGGSQGGALTFATAALNNTRVRLCVPMVPFLSDFPDYFKMASWPGNEFKNYVETEKRQTWDEVYRTLSYFDIKNLAPLIRATMLMEAGLRDETCPPHINFAAYNQVRAPKSYRVYPEAGHGVPQEFYPLKMQWIREHLGM